MSTRIICKELQRRTGAANYVIKWLLESIVRGMTDIPSLPQPGKNTITCKQAESGGFDTPQEAAAAYLEGLKTCDTERMLGTFAVESYARNFDFQAYMEYMQSYVLSQQEVKIPIANDFIQDITGCKRREQIKEDMLRQGNSGEAFFWLGRTIRGDSIGFYGNRGLYSAGGAVGTPLTGSRK